MVRSSQSKVLSESLTNRVQDSVYMLEHMVQHQQRRDDAVKVARMLSGGQRTATLQARAPPYSRSHIYYAQTPL